MFTNTSGTSYNNLVKTMSNNFNDDTQSYYIAQGMVIFKFNKAYVDKEEGSDIVTKCRKILRREPMIIYTRLQNPVDIEITNQTLINQLNAIKNAMSYNNQTNISQKNNTLPFIINASALKKND